MSTAGHSIVPPAPGQRPMAGILDSRFKYHSSVDTNLARTFRRIRKDMAAAAKHQAATAPVNRETQQP